MSALYVTYKYNGQLKRGILSSNQYDKYLNDPAVIELQIHPTQQFMEEAYSTLKGNKPNNKSLLHG